MAGSVCNLYRGFPSFQELRPLPIMKPLVIIPTYNESKNIQRIVEMILGLSDDFRILIIDDNSPDGTGRLADELAEGNQRISVIHRLGKLGLGTAYREGFKYALRRKDIKYIFEMDADFSHDPQDLLRLVSALSDTDVVVGSRYIRGVRVKNWEFSRLFISKLANIFVSLIMGLRISDITSGFVGYKREVLDSLDLNGISSNGYAFQIEMKYKTRRRGFGIKEVPITFYGREEGKSKFNCKIILEAFLLVWKLRFQ